MKEKIANEDLEGVECISGGRLPIFSDRYWIYDAVADAKGFKFKMDGEIYPASIGRREILERNDE